MTTSQENAPHRASELEEQRTVLRVLARAQFPMKRRPIEEQAFGKTGHMAWATIRALATLERLGFVERGYNPHTAQFDRCWKITDAGRRHAEGVEVFHPSGGGAS